MGMLDRYKKKTGFIQLLNLLETSSKTKQEQFLNLIHQENPHWEEALKKRILNIDRIVSWNKETLAEIISRVQPLTLAVALRHFSEEKRNNILAVISQSEQRKIHNLVTETNPTPAEVATCISKVVVEVRTLIQQGIIKLEKIDPELSIPENIEELLSQKQVSTHNYTEQQNSPSTNQQETTESKISEAETNLDFSGFFQKTKASGASSLEEKSEVPKNNKEELDFLKKKVNLLASENTQLKQELSILRNKLEQIKKIA
ncbi:MAG: hypothetical protein HUU56_00225 [Bdellovibrionaceae bacterium]|nr:hypothetical protein [Pseudobdellovibrionaceae bacterium]